MTKTLQLSAIPLSLYRKSVKGFDRSLYADVFNKYGEGRNPNAKFRLYFKTAAAPKTPQVSTVPQSIVDFLTANDFRLDSYVNGTVFDKHGRTVRLGKVLSKSPELLKLFNHDPSRRGTQIAGGTLVVVSRHPYDILGASFDRGWSSCTNLKEGENAGRLRKNIRFGLLVAYMIRNDDKNINKPVGRIMIYPYLSKAGYRLMVADTQEFGNAPPALRATVSQFVDWYNTNVPKDAYYAPKGMYINDLPTRVLTDPAQVLDEEDVEFITDVSDLATLAQSPSVEVRVGVAANKRTPVDVLDSLVKNLTTPSLSKTRNGKPLDQYHFSTIATNPNLSDASVGLLLKVAPRSMARWSPRPDVLLTLAKGKLSTDFIDRLLNNSDTPVEALKILAKVPKLPKYTLDVLADHRNITSDLLGYLLNTRKTYSALNNPLTPLEGFDDWTFALVSQHLDVGSPLPLIWSAVKSSNPRAALHAAEIVLNDLYYEPDHISRKYDPIVDFLADSKNASVRQLVAYQSRNQTALSKLVSDPDVKVRRSLSCNEKADDATFEILSKDRDERVRQGVARYSKNPEVLLRLGVEFTSEVVLNRSTPVSVLMNLMERQEIPDSLLPEVRKRIRKAKNA